MGAHALDGVIDGQSDQVHAADVALASVFLQGLAQGPVGPVGLGGRGDGREHLDRLGREAAHGGLGREHDAIGAVEDGVGHVGGLGAGRAPVLDHGFEHLGGRDDRLPCAVRFRHDALLFHGDALDGDLDAEIAAGHHDAVGGGEDGVQVLQRRGALDLGDDEGAVVQFGRGGAHGLDVLRARDEGLTHGVEPVLGGEAQPAGVVRRERADAQVDTGQVEPLA